MGLADALAEKMQIQKKNAAHTVEAVFDIIAGALMSEGKVTVMGFGTFIVKKRKARRGVKPGTTEEIHIPARKTPVFIPGAELKAKVSAKQD